MAKTEPFDHYAPEYDNWFEKNKYAFQSELNAVRKLLPQTKETIEIGVGSGIFAEPLGIKEGVEPSKAMRERAVQKGIKVTDAIAEKLPYNDASKNGAIMITTVCFVDNVYKSFLEVNRILKEDGFFIIGFVDRNSPIGKDYLKHQDESLFYKDATFFGTEEIYSILSETGFKITNTCQTIFGNIMEINAVQPVLDGYGKGGFVVIKAQKILNSHSL